MVILRTPHHMDAIFALRLAKLAQVKFFVPIALIIMSLLMELVHAI